MIEFFQLLIVIMYVLIGQSPLHSARGIAYTCSVAVLYLRHRLINWIWRRPASTSLSTGVALDLCCSKQQLIVENALLRQQLIVLRRQVNRPQLNNTDRALLVLLASKLRAWKNALLIVQPDTLVRWHRQGFRLFWKRKSKSNSRQPKLPAETVELIKQMAQANRLWGAERIRGELLKLNIKVCKRTIQKYMRQARRSGPSGRKPNQNWSTFLRNHAHQVWACDWFFGCAEFRPVYDLFFRPLFIFVIIELGSRRVVHFRITRSPTDEWVAQMERSVVLREATPYGDAPRFLIRDNDSKYGEKFSRMAEVGGIDVLRTPYKAPRANAFCERFLGTARRECLDHILILGEKHLHQVVKEYVQYYNSARPHQRIGQTIPELVRPGLQGLPSVDGADPKIISFPILGGLHHDYRRAA